MSHDTIGMTGPAHRRATLWALAIAGGSAVAVSQLHVLPPMVCFSVLLAGLIALGAAALAMLPRHARPARVRVPRAAAIANLRAAATVHHASH